MAIKELSKEQIRTWTLEQKDEWWLKNVYRGNAPQLTLRAALTGAILGGVLSLTNLYVGIQTGWTLGVGITSVILSFALYKVLARLKIGSEITVLENNAMQSVATSAGYMTAPMISSLAAYMMASGQVIPMWQTFWWIVVLSLLGVLFAFPLKKRFINEEQMPFPEGYAAGVVMDSLHSHDPKEGQFKGKLLFWGAGVSALIELLRSEKIMETVSAKWATLPAFWDDIVYKYFTPTILGTPLKDLTIRFETSIVMLGTGGLIGMPVAMSLLLGAIINFGIIAPIYIANGEIQGVGFKNITMFSMWGGVAMMTSAALTAFFSKPKTLIDAFKQIRGNKNQKDVLGEIELPMRVFVIGIPIIGFITVYLGHEWFDVHWILGIIAIPLVFIFTLIAVHSTALTSITPGSALAKLTQISYALMAPGNVKTNLMTAGITSEVSLNASNLLMDIKPGYMLGAKPRQQAIGHVIGIFAGGLVAVPVFYMIFQNDISLFSSDRLPMPSATVWKAVSDVLSKGLSSLSPSSQIAVVIGLVAGFVLEIISLVSKGRFPISAVSIGLGFVIPFFNTLAMAIGALIFWLARQFSKDPKSLTYRSFVDNQETLAAGVIAGGSIIGILIILFETAA